MILCYAFSNQWSTNISRRVLSELEIKVGATLATAHQIHFLPVIRWPRPFFKKYIEHSNYSLIIGLGNGTKFTHKIHVETQARNAFYDQSIYPFSPILLDLSLPNIDNFNSEFFQISSNMGSHNCNWLAYSTQLYLNQHSPQTKHLFLHLPQQANAVYLANNIIDLFNSNQIFNS